MVSRTDGGPAGDRGYATVWVLAAMTVVIVAAAAAMSVGVATVERHRAAAAADAVALEVAMEAIDGAVIACRDGAAIGHLDGASMVRCGLSDSIATVTVEVGLPGPLARFGVATGRARAGPASVTGVS